MIGDQLEMEMQDEGNKIRVIIKRPGDQYANYKWIDNTLGAMQKIVGGYIETVTVFEDLVIICNEEGRLRGLEPNCEICGADFVGPIILAGIKGEEFADVPDGAWMLVRTK